MTPKSISNSYIALSIANNNIYADETASAMYSGHITCVIICVALQLFHFPNRTIWPLQEGFMLDRFLRSCRLIHGTILEGSRVDLHAPLI